MGKPKWCKSSLVAILDDPLLVVRGMDCDLGPRISDGDLFPKLSAEVRCEHDEVVGCGSGDLFSPVSTSLVRV